MLILLVIQAKKGVKSITNRGKQPSVDSSLLPSDTSHVLHKQIPQCAIMQIVFHSMLSRSPVHSLRGIRSFHASIPEFQLEGTPHCYLHMAADIYCGFRYAVALHCHDYL